MGSCQSRDTVSINTGSKLAPQTNGVPKSIELTFGEEEPRTSAIHPEDTCSTTLEEDEDYAHHRPSAKHDKAEEDVSVRSVSSQGSSNSRSRQKRNPLGGVKKSESAVGLDRMIEARKEEGNIVSNVVHIEVPFGKPIEEVYDGVHDGVVLGSGISGVVRLCTHKKTGVKYAVKCLDLGLIESESGLQQLREEIFIMCQLDHPNIVRLEEVYESHSEIYLVQELCIGGELFDRLDEQPDYHYTEEQCAMLVKQMLKSVRYLHSKGIVHRDLKLENFLFTSTDTGSELKMIDFGLSKHFKFGEVQHEAVGTPYTVAPEVIRGRYDERCDVWAIGVITYLLLSGDPPFGGCGGPEPLMTVRDNILRGEFEFEPEEIWANVSEPGKDFIKSILVTNPLERATVQQAQLSPWLNEWADKQHSSTSKDLSPNVVKALVSFKEYSDMRKLLCEVLSFTLLPDQIQDLRREFEVLDKDGSGEISLSTLKKVLMESAGSGSLGALTEEEVEDIFNAMRVRKSDTTIHWHEFIAAGLSQCKVDDRNLRLAFDRLDSDHKGYITFDNVMNLMGSCGIENGEDAIRTMYEDSLVTCRCQDANISYDTFLLLMKGQTREIAEITRKISSKTMLEPVPEEGNLAAIPEELVPFSLPKTNPTYDFASPKSAGSDDDWCFSYDDDMDGPLTMDDDGDHGSSLCMGRRLLDTKAAICADGGLGVLGKETERGTTAATDGGNSSVSHPTPFRPTCPGTQSAPVSTTPVLNSLQSNRFPLTKSYPERSKAQDGMAQKRLFPDARPCVALPEHMHDNEKIEDLIKNNSVSPLIVNRNLYRAHRQMRLAVLEASKRFDDQKNQRAMEAVLRQKQQNETSNLSSAPNKFGAGLVMRHGQNKDEIPFEVHSIMKQTESEQENRMKDALQKSGRGKRNRKKTVSDMSAMMAALSPQPTPTKASEAGANPHVANISPATPIHQDKPTLFETKGSVNEEVVIGTDLKENDKNEHVTSVRGIKESASDGKLDLCLLEGKFTCEAQ